eukprot:19790-Pyramimonas_sp.AAC.1
MSSVRDAKARAPFEKRPPSIFPACSLPRLCLEGFLLCLLKGPGSGARPGRFPRHPPRGSPSD